MAEQAMWYVVHTYSGYENKVAQNLETIVANRRLQDLIHEVKVPVMMEPEIKDGKERMVERKIFPGYVLVKMVMTDESWYIVRNCRGVTGFVGPSSKPVPLSQAEVDKLGVETVTEPTVDYEVGDNVEINAGPLEGFVGLRGRDRHGASQGAREGFDVRARNARRTGAGSGQTPVTAKTLMVRAAICGFYRALAVAGARGRAG